MVSVDKTPRLSRFLYMCACVLSGGSLMTIPLCVDIVHFYAAAVGFGFFFGNIHYLGSMLFIEFFGPDRLSGCFGMVYLSYTIASFTGNPLAGMVAEMTSFRGAEFMFIGSSIVLAGFVMIPSAFVTKGRLTSQRIIERKDLESSIRPSENSIINNTSTTRMVSLEISEKDSAYGAISLTI
ncbi:uncharacterized protein LOC117342604 [Pecten maximus]|uniref:uncharacterized protein LOC117342604 n=1 Tax=Pecten maximus TaxID=6579 RepID=UPI001457F195|nr:uncharacterized protein LOC117342604 [Pecten maximus]